LPSGITLYQAVDKNEEIGVFKTSQGSTVPKTANCCGYFKDMGI